MQLLVPEWQRIRLRYFLLPFQINFPRICNFSVFSNAKVTGKLPISESINMNFKFASVLWENSKQNLKYKHLDNLIPGHKCFIVFKIIQLISHYKKPRKGTIKKYFIRLEHLFCERKKNFKRKSCAKSYGPPAIVFSKPKFDKLFHGGPIPRCS